MTSIMPNIRHPIRECITLQAATKEWNTMHTPYPRH